MNQEVKPAPERARLAGAGRNGLLVLAALLVCGTTAHCGESSPPVEPEERTLAVSVTAADDIESGDALDLRDLEHYAVSKLASRRFSTTAFTSIEDTLESDEGVYVVDVGIDEAEIAQRPTWSWVDRRFLDDQILHLELSLAVTRLQDTKSLGTIHLCRDYRAEEYGKFSSPQALRGAIYDAVAALFSDFAAGVERGDFGADVETFQRPFALADVLDRWSELSPELKLALVLAALVFLVVFLKIVFKVACGTAELLEPTPVIGHHDERPMQSRKTSAVLQGCTVGASDAKENGDDEDE